MIEETYYFTVSLCSIGIFGCLSSLAYNVKKYINRLESNIDNEKNY